MAIRHVDELTHDPTGAVVLLVGGPLGVPHEGLYHKCPESGDVQVRFAEPPPEGTVTLVLQDGNDSRYVGNFDADGRFGHP